jgi:CheY-like chemotaxis protein
MDLKILYFDDEKSDLERYGTLIEENSDSNYCLKVEGKLGTFLLKNINILDNISLDLILVDFDFSNVDSANEVLGMNGVALSNLLRQKLPNVPIILLTRKPIERSEVFPHNEAILACIDDIKFKEDLIPPNNSELIKNLISISIGYKKLRNCEPKNSPKLLEMISAPESSFEALKLSYPKDLAKRKIWTSFEATTWIRKILMNFPGILYDEIFTATYLGISLDSFREFEVQRFFNNARYTGVFSEEKNLWWKTKLLEIASQNMVDSEKSSPLRKGFIKFWERTTSQRLSPSVCEFKGDSPADTVCYLSKKPVMLKYSLRYDVDNRPDVMDEARVSFKSIKSRDDVNFDLFDEVAQEIINARNLRP